MAQRPPSKLKLPSTRSQTQSGAPGRPSGLRPPASIPKPACNATVCSGAKRQQAVREQAAASSSSRSQLPAIGRGARPKQQVKVASRDLRPSNVPSTSRVAKPALNRARQQVAAHVGLDSMPPPPNPVKHVDASRRLAMKPKEKSVARATGMSSVAAPVMETPQGPQQVLQQAFLERKVQRDEEAEQISKHLTLIDVNERTGRGRQLELDEQQIDPTYGLEEGLPSEAVTIQSSVSISADYAQKTKSVVRERVGDLSKSTEEAIRVDPATISELVNSEKEDIEDTLKMLPPDLEMTPEKFTLKKRLANLRLNSESVVLLEQSVVCARPSPDEAQTEASPEVIASIMNAVEKGVTPQSPPSRIFNTLFTETANSQFVPMSSVAAGPMQDVVIPAQVPETVHNVALSQEMAELSEELTKNEAERPQADVFTEKHPEIIQPRRRLVYFKPVESETAPWGDLDAAMNLVGAEPASILTPTEVNDEMNVGDAMCAGIEYFLDTDPMQYVSRVQLRGSVPPKWFPGYMVALPELSDVVKIAKSPNDVFFSAWKAVQPKLIPPESNISF